ncbi:unnamed protein product, partial [Gulo gulo]
LTFICTKIVHVSLKLHNFLVKHIFQFVKYPPGQPEPRSLRSSEEFCYFSQNPAINLLSLPPWGNGCD